MRNGGECHNPLSAMEMAEVHQIDLAYTNATELITAFLHVLGYQLNGANALTERTKGHEFFDNAALYYSGSTDDDGLNSGVGRFSADPAAGLVPRTSRRDSRRWCPGSGLERSLQRRRERLRKWGGDGGGHRPACAAAPFEGSVGGRA
jgi:hypothetical protein